MDNRPIGIFDSGLGGLSVWREVRRQLPGESVIYFGDGKNCPYGTKSPERIRELTFGAVGRLLDKGAKIIVIACNTATVAAISELRQNYPQCRFVGMEPALKTAVGQTRNGTVAVIATIAYMASDGYVRLVERYGNGVKVLSSPGKGFALLVEQEKAGTPEALTTISHVIDPLIEQGADTLVLGCTHYPFLLGDIKKVIGSRQVQIINPAPAVAKRVAGLLQEADALASPQNEPSFEFLSLAGPEYTRKLGRMARKALSMDI
ncbi:MAG: glutamate racemase [Rikenellaceae bacterium]|nr:glutamate racemase [Rikenellaceae bacterium]